MIQDKIFFDEKDPTGLSYNTPFTFYGSYQGRLYSKTPTGSIKYYTQNSDLSAYATTGSNQFSGSQTITGSLTVTGTITGTVAGTTSTASYVEYTNVANKPALISGSSQVTYSGLTGIPSGIVSGSSQVTYSGLTGVPSGIVSGSAQVASFGIFATTGSNGFNGSQSITGSLTVTGQVVAQTLNVQQVTSSIVYSSGSNIFGNTLGNTQQFTGSVSITGSLNTSIAAFGSAATVFLTSDSGTIKSRTAAQTLSDIAALPLAGGTLTGPLTGSSASFTGNALFGGSSALSGLAGGISVNGSTNSGINFRIADTLRGYVYVAGNGSMNLESTSGSVVLSPNGSPALTIASTGAATFSSSVTVQSVGISVTIDDAGKQGYTITNSAAVRTYKIIAGIDGTSNTGFSIRNVTAGRNELLFTDAGAATFASNVTLTSGYLSVDGFGNAATNYITMRSGFVPNTSGGIGLMAIDHSGASTDGLACYGHDGISLYTAQTERMRISSAGITTFTAPIEGNGIVKVNSTEAQGADIGGVLTIGGNINNSGQTNTPFAFIAGRKTNSTVSNDDAYLALGTRSSTIGTGTNYWQYISTSGAIRFLAYGAGTLVTDASGNVTASSDERMKNISGFYTNGLSAIKKIKPINFKWKEETELDTKEFYTGFSAQNLHEAIPESAGIMSNGDLTIQDRPIMATIVNAINELNDIILKQQVQIDSLKNQMK